MEPVVELPAEAELHLLTDWSDPDARSRRWKAAIGAIAINVGLIIGMGVLPEGAFRPPDEPRPIERVTPLLMPPLTELTQKAPNNGKVSKNFEVKAPELPRHAILTPPSPPPAKRAEPPAPPVVQPAPPTALPEPPKIETAPPQVETPRALQQTATAPPPQIQTVEKPKLTFEPVPGPAGPAPPEKRVVPMPSNPIDDLAKEVTRGGSTSGLSLGDSGLSQSSARGNPLDAVQLKSDPLGVDFTPYLIQLIATVRRNWLAVIPQSARMGHRGQVALQFIISKGGNIDKVVIAEPSGSRPLDLAAVAGVSASNPLPPLPRDFKGQQIVLQLNFKYY
jgi:TonB family protein